MNAAAKAARVNAALTQCALVGRHCKLGPDFSGGKLSSTDPRQVAPAPHSLTVCEPRLDGAESIGW